MRWPRRVQYGSGRLDGVMAAEDVARIVLALDLRQAVVMITPIRGLPALVVEVCSRHVASGAGREAAERLQRRVHPGGLAFPLFELRLVPRNPRPGRGRAGG